MEFGMEGTRRYFRRERMMVFDRGSAGTRGRARKLLLAGTALAGAALFPSLAQAQSVWGGTGSTTTTSDYNLGTNWSSLPAGAPPNIAGQSALFDTSGSSVIAVTSGIAPDSWTFSSNPQSY